MAENSAPIFILEDDGYFREILTGICSGLGKTTAVSNLESAIIELTRNSYRMLLLDWHLIQQGFKTFSSALENFQPHADRLALFTVPDLPNVISAMKSGFSDVLWAAQDKETLAERMKDILVREKPAPIAHAFMTRLAETVTEKAMAEKTSLFQARREFSKTFLQQVLAQQKLRRSQLAHLMNVSPRTLHRHLSS